MNQSEGLAEQFEAHRSHLRSVAYGMLGSLPEAEDAVQEAWIRFSRHGTRDVANMRGWLTTIVARTCLDMLRGRRSRREDLWGDDVQEANGQGASSVDPEYEAMLADSVGLAMLVVLDRLNPPERIAFVLHDIFAVSFEEIAPMVNRTPAAARQLASRARRRVQGDPTVVQEAHESQKRQLVEAFLAASRAGDWDALLAVLDPDVVLTADAMVMPPGSPTTVRGAAAVAKHSYGRAQAARAALVNGSVGVVVAPRGRLYIVMDIRVFNGRIREIEVIGDPARLRQVEVTVLKD